MSLKHISPYFTLLLLFAFGGCEKQWPYKETSNLIEGKWNFKQVSVSDLDGNHDSTFNSLHGFAYFQLNKKGTSGLRYSFIKGDTVTTTYTIHFDNQIVVNNSESGIDPFGINLFGVYSISEHNNNSITLTGRCIKGSDMQSVSIEAVR